MVVSRRMEDCTFAGKLPVGAALQGVELSRGVHQRVPYPEKQLLLLVVGVPRAFAVCFRDPHNP